MRREAPGFVDSIDIQPSETYRDEAEELSILVPGPMAAEAMGTSCILKPEYGCETRLPDLHTLKPMDTEAVHRAAPETGVIVTAEEHQIGALARRVSAVLAESPRLNGVPVIAGTTGVKDRFGESGAPWELVKELEVNAEQIAIKALELMAANQERAVRPWGVL
jgi:transketolase